MTAIDRVKASKAKCKRHRDNWKRKADDTLRGVVQRLVEHPNVDTGNVRYLQSVEDAADILEHARGLDGFGERAFGLAQELRQFHSRLSNALQIAKPREELK